ncbi:MAG: HlyD family secretion protein [Pseudomonadales bacterium]|nr:HlyD family secretion protein [Pseudomonadales bacterium]
MRKIILTGGLITGLLFALLWGRNWWVEGRFWEFTDNAYTHGDITVISAKVPGIVAEVNVSANQRVETGDILISMQKETFNARLARAVAEVSSAEASLVRLDTQNALQHANIAAKSAEVRAATSDLTRTQLDQTRAETLKDKGFAQKQAYDHALTDVDRAKAELSRTQANLTAAKAQIQVLAAEKGEVHADISHAKAEVRLAQIALYLSDIRAPRAGIVGAKHVEKGEYIQVGARKMAIVSLDEAWVIANFKETQLKNMNAGQKAVVTVDAFDESIDGVVESLSPASGAEFSLLPPDNATGNFTKIVQRVPVKIILDKNNPLVKRLRSGMSVAVEVDTRSIEDESDLVSLSTAE